VELRILHTGKKATRWLAEAFVQALLLKEDCCCSFVPKKHIEKNGGTELYWAVY
jgi:hypothetical protein